MLIHSIEESIGNTPLLEIPWQVSGLRYIKLYAKLENLNPFGSVKDRVAKVLLDEAKEKMTSEHTILEASSGNTGKALAVLCSMSNIPFKSYTNRIRVPEQRMVLRLLGADIVELPGLSDCPDPNDPNDPTKICTDLSVSHPEKYIYTDQYFNKKNLEVHYQRTGPEIDFDLGRVDYLIGGLGTCGTTIGVGKYLREKNPSMKMLGIVSGAGQWIPGIRNMNELFEVGFFQQEFYDELESGTVDDAVSGTLELARRCGVLCGPSSGLNYRLGVKYLKRLDTEENEGKKAVFIVCDSLDKYYNYLKKIREDLFTGKERKEGIDSILDDEAKAANCLSPQEFAAIEYKSRDWLVIDIRGHFAYSIGHLADSINLTDVYFASILEEGEAFPKTKKILVLCNIGDISKRYVAYMRKKGYEAFSLEGGLTNWKNLGFPLEKTIKLNS